jgi:hypothetical protein
MIAAETVKLLNDDTAWEDASVNQIKYATERFAQETLVRQLISAIENTNAAAKSAMAASAELDG